MLSSKSISTLVCSSIPTLLSTLLPKRIEWVPVQKQGSFLGRTFRQNYWRVYWPGQSVDCYCQYMLCQCPALPITHEHFGHFFSPGKSVPYRAAHSYPSETRWNHSLATPPASTPGSPRNSKRNLCRMLSDRTLSIAAMLSSSKLFLRTCQPRQPAKVPPLSRMQLTLHATRQTPLMAFRAWCKQCLPGR